MGNTSSVKAYRGHTHGNLMCTMKHGRRHRYKRSHKHKKHYRYSRKGGGTSPLNPFATTSKKHSKKHTAKKPPSLLESVLKLNAFSKFPRGPPKKARASPPIAKKRSVKRDFKIESIEEEEPSSGRRKSF